MILEVSSETPWSSFVWNQLLGIRRHRCEKLPTRIPGGTGAPLSSQGEVGTPGGLTNEKRLQGLTYLGGTGVLLTVPRLLGSLCLERDEQLL